MNDIHTTFVVFCLNLNSKLNLFSNATRTEKVEIDEENYRNRIVGHNFRFQSVLRKN